MNTQTSAMSDWAHRLERTSQALRSSEPTPYFRTDIVRKTRSKQLGRTNGVTVTRHLSVCGWYAIWNRGRSTAVATLMILVLAPATTADARHSRHHRFEYRQGSSELGSDLPVRSHPTTRGLLSLSQLLPRDWKMQPPDSNWTGKRFVSPEGSAWFALYSSPVVPDQVTTHMKEIAFGEGESITYLRGEKDWIAVSGLKGDRIFYRKAVIACAGRSWHQIAFEYPINMKQAMDAFVSGAAVGVQNSEDDGCDKELWSSTSQQTERPR
jgi:hypothetical protein